MAALYNLWDRGVKAGETDEAEQKDGRPTRGKASPLDHNKY